MRWTGALTPVEVRSKLPGPNCPFRWDSGLPRPSLEASIWYANQSGPRHVSFIQSVYQQQEDVDLARCRSTCFGWRSGRPVARCLWTIHLLDSHRIRRRYIEATTALQTSQTGTALLQLSVKNVVCVFIDSGRDWFVLLLYTERHHHCL